MEYLHKHKEEFINAVNLASEYFHILPVIVEKDYCSHLRRRCEL